MAQNVQNPPKGGSKNTPANTKPSTPSQASKVQPGKSSQNEPETDDDEDEDEEKIPRTPYMEVAPKAALDAEGRLRVVPNRQALIGLGIADDEALVAYDNRKHLKPKRTDFTTEDIFIDFRADFMSAQAEKFAKRAVILREQAESFRKFGDPEKRAKVMKAQKVAASMRELLAQLKADGIDTAELGLELDAE